MIRLALVCLVAAWLSLPLGAEACSRHPHAWHDHVLSVDALGDTGMMIVTQDVNGDGVADRALVFQLQSNGDFFEWPLFYFEGLDETGRAEEVWHDQGVDGLCWQIELYYKRSMSY